MPAQDFASYLGSYARVRSPPGSVGNATVTAVEREGCGYRVSTDAGQWHARAVVVATGACDAAVSPGDG